MNPAPTIRRLPRNLAAAPAAALAGAAAAAALATSQPRPPGWNKHPPLPLGHVAGPVYKVPAHTAVAGGMPGWQIALITAAAFLLATGLAVALYRLRAARRRVTASAA